MKKKDKKPHICIVAHFAYGALSGGAVGHIGGVERQTSLLAKWLAARGYRVSLITWDEGQPDHCIIDGVENIKLCRRQDGIWGLRFFAPRWTSLIRALAQADADVYYHNCGEYVTGQVALWCKSNKRSFVFSTASDLECDPKLPDMNYREKVLFRTGLKHADTIIVQTKKQQKQLIDGIGLPSRVLPMPCVGPSADEFAPPVFPVHGPFRVGWAARIAAQKRLEILVEVASCLPDVQFEVGGMPFDKAGEVYSRPIIDAASSLPNVTLCGRIAREDMPNFYRRLQLFCCTSWFEGFPNTFLEAWSHGLPIVSTFDPDGLIGEMGLGLPAHDLSSLVAGIKFFRNNPDQWRKSSEQARAYYLSHHTMDEVMGRIEQVLVETFENNPAVVKRNA